MGAKPLLFAMLLVALSAMVSAAPLATTAGPYDVALFFNPDPPQAGQHVDLRISIRQTATGEMEQNFTAAIRITKDKEIIYKLEGTYPTSELLIPYQFAEGGTYTLTVGIPEGTGVHMGSVDFTVASMPQPPTGLGGLPLWIRIGIGILIIAAFWKFRIPRKPQRKR